MTTSTTSLYPLLLPNLMQKSEKSLKMAIFTPFLPQKWGKGFFSEKSVWASLYPLMPNFMQKIRKN